MKTDLARLMKPLLTAPPNQSMNPLKEVAFDLGARSPYL